MADLLIGKVAVKFLPRSILWLPLTRLLRS